MSNDDTVIAVKVDMLRHLFDLAAASMNFGSGFIDTDDVNLMRATAEIIGVDPLEGTPDNFKGQYPHEFNPVKNLPWQTRLNPDLPDPHCYHCRGSAEAFIHNVNWGPS